MAFRRTSPSLLDGCLSANGTEVIQETGNAGGVEESHIYKSRRPHTKSRAGCLRCKKDKRKCDERSPSCSRCEKRNITCVKPEGKPRRRSKSSHDATGVAYAECGQWVDTDLVFNSNISVSCCNVAMPVSDAGATDLSASLPLQEDVGQWDDSWGLLDTLAPLQRELYNYYLNHTAKSIAVDDAELHALRTEIGSLASDSNIILNSVLALAAVDKCHCLIWDSAPQPEYHAQITGLLLSAEQYHWQAVRQTRSDAVHMGCYDHVMANAALMVLYGCASHGVRIRLASKEYAKMHLASELAPVRLQWMSLIWAVHIAYSGLTNTKPNYFSVKGHQWASLAQPHQDIVWQSFEEEQQLSSNEESTDRTRRLFSPIVAATWASAVGKLHELVSVVVGSYQAYSLLNEEQENDLYLQFGDDYLSDVFVCMRSLNLLHNIFSEVFSTDLPTKPSTSSHETGDTHEGYKPPNGLSELQPWLRGYLARVTSRTPHKPLRRIVMAFVHKMPPRYFNLQKHSVLAKSSLHKLVIDIFAHWLVLVMLLDGVWWISDIGTWELNRVILTMRSFSVVDSRELADNWWPHNMYIINEKLSNV